LPQGFTNQVAILKMNIVVAGIMGRYPYGGVAWCSLMYLLGLQRLGHKVWYLEDTGECNFDPVQNTVAVAPDYALGFIQTTLQPYALGDRWCYVDYQGNYHGHSRESWLQICANADLFLNLSGGSWFWREEYLSIPHKIFIDSDPAFTQLAIAKGEPWYVEFFRGFDALFTFGRNIGTRYCDVPTAPFEWEHTWQPVVLGEWSPPPQQATRPWFTTIMSWKIHSFEDIGGNKDIEFLKVLDLPRRTTAPIELAINGPMPFLRQHGWRCRDAFSVSRDLQTYRNYIRSSLGEFSVAKHTYVSTNSGWFSDRTECYLASGRPAVVQDTGFSRHLPTGEGLFAYASIDEAIGALDSVQTDPLRHSRTAREIAESHFSSDVVLSALLDRATAPHAVGIQPG
jgi:hypothetical protein